MLLHNLITLIRGQFANHRRLCKPGYGLAPLLLAVVAAMGVFPHAAQAGTPSFVQSIRWGGRQGTNSVAVGDLNGDGALDIVQGNYGQSYIYLNDGQGGFPSTGVAFGSEQDTWSVTVGDLNGDGFLDIVQGGQPSYVYLNDGQGGFPSTGVALGSAQETRSVAVGDLNGDGALDLVQGGQSSYVYLNDGQGGFPSTGIAWGSAQFTWRVAVGDLNGDGALDLVQSNGSQNYVYLNDGQGSFPAQGQAFGSRKSTYSVAVGDLNGDGALDLIEGNAGDFFGSYSGQSYIYLNDGQGGFSSTGIAFGSEQDTGSVAVGDLNGDGALDIVQGNSYGQQDYVYLNDGQGGFSSTGIAFGSGQDTWGVAVGDFNGDGFLDIVQDNRGQSYVYLNDRQGGFPSTGVAFGSVQETISVAVGDLNGDGALDIIQGNGSDFNGNSGQSYIYLNDRQGGFPSTGIALGSAQNTWSVAVGDLNGDGALDIVQGNAGQLSYIYLNDGQGGFPSTGIAFGSGQSTFSVAVGDLNGDGALDIIQGNGGQDYVYLNDGQGGFSSTGVAFGSGQSTFSVAVGDLNGDGALDIIQGNDRQLSYIYLNDRQGGFPSTGIAFGSEQETWSMAVGDLNGDGALDIVQGNLRQPSYVYLNDRQGGFPATGVTFGSEQETFNVAVGDFNGDGFLDIVQGNGGQDYVYLNDGQGGFPSTGVALGGQQDTTSRAVGDLNGDGFLDVVGSSYVYLNGLRRATGLANNGALITVTRPLSTGNANFFSSPVLLSSPTIPISYTLFDREDDHVGRVAAFYSLDGGGKWLPAVATPDTVTANLTAAHTGTKHVYTWDTFASGFFGQSDDVVLRLVAYAQPSSDTTASTGVYRYTHTVAGPYQWPFASASTFPFRLRGTQVRVLQPEYQPVAGALVYRLLNGQSSNAQPYANHGGLSYHTDSQGYLQGHGELHNDDRLAALWPVSDANLITFTHSVSLYHTSAKPTADTLDMKPVLPPGVQVLTVSADNKLLLFNLDVALEWDTRKDTQFMAQLQFNLQRTSQLLFDWTNGQAALGQVRIFQDAKRNAAIAGFQPWNDSHIRIYATNRMRPSATVGGIISPTLAYTETVLINGKAKTVTYGAGQVRMGAIWNRYGETSGTLGEDWPRALAHELGHYLFFLEDDYLGVNEQGVLVTIPAEGKPAESCPGVMNDPYREAQSEFQPALGWITSGCTQTLSQQSVGRSDWETITRFYPLTAPTQSFTGQNQGPGTLPLAVTQLTVISPTATAQTVGVPLFYLLNAAGGTYLPGRNVQTYLFQGDWLTELGQPTLDQVQAWGARPGDRLCVFEPAAGYQGCEVVQERDDQIAMQPFTGWQPEIRVTPVTSRTIAMSVTASVGNGQLAARLYPTDQPAPPCILLQPAGPGRYTGVFPTLPTPALDGYVHVWLQPGATCSESQGAAVTETVTGYAIGGNPVHRRARRTLTRGDGVHRRARRAPAISADGQVIVFGEALETNEDEEWFFTLQATSVITGLPPGRTLVGQAYRLTASPNAPPLTDTSISFSYLGDQMPAEEENFARLYFWATTAAACQSQPAPCWQPLDTFIDTAYNVASAKTQGPGLYALMSSLEIALTGPGWNLFAYTVQYTQTVPQALASLAGHYTVIWGYDPSTPNDPWRAYSPKVAGTIFAPLVNDLAYLEYGRGYWIQMLDDATLHLPSTPAVMAANSGQMGQLPTIYYGSVLPSTDFVPTAGTSVTAWVDGKLCGQGQSQNLGGQIVYAIQVAAESAQAACGAVGRQVSFKVNDVPMVTRTLWDNTDVWHVALAHHFDHHLLLPLIARQAK